MCASAGSGKAAAAGGSAGQVRQGGSGMTSSLGSTLRHAAKRMYSLQTCRRGEAECGTVLLPEPKAGGPVAILSML